MCVDVVCRRVCGCGCRWEGERETVALHKVLTDDEGAVDVQQEPVVGLRFEVVLSGGWDVNLGAEAHGKLGFDADADETRELLRSGV